MTSPRQTESLTVTLTATSPAAPGTLAGTGTAAIAADLDGYNSMEVEADLQGATGGVLDVYLQASYDHGATWTDYAHFTQLADGAAAVKYSFTTTREQIVALAVVGKDLTPTLAAGTIRGGDWGDRMRLLFKAGAGTSAGAVQTVKLFLS